MKRRAFLGTGMAAGAGLGVAAVAGPAAAQDLPEIRWRLASSYTKSLDTIFGGVEFFCARVSDLTGGRFRIRPYAAGDIVPGLQVLDAVQNNTVEIGQTALYYYVGKDPTFAFDTTLPFGLTARQHMAWMLHGGGGELLADFLRSYNIVSFAAGNTGAQMGGWFRKEIASVDDLRGLKMRIGGLAGEVISRLGVVPQQLVGGDVYPALERGTIDATEWVGPHDDEKLGFYKVAKYYYYPGWWEGQGQIPVIVNLDSWNGLPAPYQAAIRAAAAEANTWMLAKYDAVNAAALKRLVAQGTQLRAFPVEVMEAGYKAAFALYEEIAATNPRFKAVYESWARFRDDEILWFRICENAFSDFVFRQYRKG